jgi:hypothetical protein
LIVDKLKEERIFLANFACRVFQQYRRNLVARFGFCEEPLSTRLSRLPAALERQLRWRELSLFAAPPKAIGILVLQ